jgi:hypothetical protein
MLQMKGYCSTSKIRRSDLLNGMNMALQNYGPSVQKEIFGWTAKEFIEGRGKTASARFTKKIYHG